MAKPQIGNSPLIQGINAINLMIDSKRNLKGNVFKNIWFSSSKFGIFTRDQSDKIKGSIFEEKCF